MRPILKGKSGAFDTLVAIFQALPPERKATLRANVMAGRRIACGRLATYFTTKTGFA